MLPYHLCPFSQKSSRSSSKSNTQANRRVVERDCDPLHRISGGPIQDAIEKDLLETRTAFLDAVQQRRQSSGTPFSATRRHCAKGEVFAAFRRAFLHSNLAYIHTRTIPPKCDRESYSQLVFAACLALLEQDSGPSIQSPSGWLERASYSLFCLYALYESSPLPRKARNRLQMIALGIQGENPKALHRRSFQSRIRVARRHYAIMQRIRDESLARQADCQQRRMTALEQSCRKEEGVTWDCRCAVATDTISTIDRLFPSLELCHYSGPCGLEALAGHSDYSYAISHSCNDTQSNSSGTTPTVPLIVLPSEVMTSLPAELETNLLRYREAIGSLQMATTSNNHASRQIERVRRAMKPLYSQSLGSLWAAMERALFDRAASGGLVSDTTDQVVHRLFSSRARENVGNAPELEVPLTESGNALRETMVAGPAQNVESDPNMSYEVVLPVDLPSDIQNGVTASLNVLLRRGCLKRRRREEGEAGVFDALEQSTDSSVVTGRATMDAPHVRATTKPRATPFGEEFLQHDFGDAELLAGESNTQGYSEDENDSDTGSAVGRKALRELLSSVQVDVPLTQVSRKQEVAFQPLGPEDINVLAVKETSDASLALALEANDESGDSTSDIYCGAGQTALRGLLSRARTGTGTGNL